MRKQICRVGTHGRYAEIQDELYRARIMYHVFKEPIINDMRYDALIKESVNLLKEHPEAKNGKLLARSMSDQILSHGKLARHDFPMLQLNRKYDLAGLISWLKILPADATIDIQTRIIGVELDLVYIDGQLHKAITSGDGINGIDVTINAYCIEGISEKVNMLGRTCIRGVVTSKTMVVNTGGEVVGMHGLDLKQHVVKQLNKAMPDERYSDLMFVAHSVYNPVEQFANWNDWDIKLRMNGFRVPKSYACDLKAGIYEPGHWEEILEAIQKRVTSNSAYLAPFKGLVMKVLEMEHRYDLGYTSRFPEWAIAYTPVKGFTNEPETTSPRTVQTD